MLQRLEPIWATVARVKAALSPETTFLGFAGSPWTVATYMVAGQGSREQAEARTLAYLDPGKFAAIIDRIEAITVDYLSGQVEGRGRRGAIVRQLVGQPRPRRVRALGDRPDRADRRRAFARAIPTRRSSAFPRARAASLRAYAAETGVDAIGLDETVDPAWANRELPAGPAGPGQSRSARADRRRRRRWPTRSQRILDAFAGRPHIFNLGHGIQQTTPIAHVEQLVALVKG